MKQIIIPSIKDVSLPFYLAVEEWVAQNLPEGEYFFAWQVAPTVICGRHQDIAAEINLEFARENNIDVVRRKSGGGAVYADRNNVMFSYITPSDSVQSSFHSYTSMICSMLRSLGINAEATGRNDIAVNDKKIAGNAFFKLPGKSIVHGTMLYDADFETMNRVLTPSRAKRLSKGVVSVPSRVTTLRNLGLDISCSEFIGKTLNFLCRDGEYRLTEDDLKQIDVIYSTYLDPGFLKIEEISSENHRTYIPGVGEIGIKFLTDADGLIKDVSLSGDFFHLQNVQKELTDKLLNVPYRRRDIENILDTICLDSFIVGLNHENIKSILPKI